MLVQACAQEGITIDLLANKMKSLLPELAGSEKPNLNVLKSAYFPGHTWKANAATQMKMCALLQYVLTHGLEPSAKERLANSLASFNALVEEIHILKLLKRTNWAPLRAVLADKQRQHMQMFLRVHGSDHVKPKHHYRLHLSRQSEDFMQDCMVHERKHRAAKAEVEARGANLQALDGFITARLNLIQMEEFPRCFRYAHFPELANHSWRIGLMEIRLGMPLLLVKANQLGVVQDVQVQGASSFFHLALYVPDRKEHSAIQTWTSSDTHVLFPTDGTWVLPDYWKIAAKTAVTIN